MDRLVRKTMAEKSPEAQYQAAKPHFQLSEANTFHHMQRIVSTAFFLW